jgi:hypothetical protein
MYPAGGVSRAADIVEQVARTGQPVLAQEYHQSSSKK